MEKALLEPEGLAGKGVAKMKMMIGKILLALVAVSMLGGCATHSTPQNTAMLDAVIREPVNVAKYTTVTVMPFTLAEGVTIEKPKFAENFAIEIAARIRDDHPGVFRTVGWHKSKQKPDEVIVTGAIRGYKQGSSIARNILPGLGGTSFEGEMVIKDAVDGKVLLTASFDKLGLVGGIRERTIDHITAESAVAIAKTVALWKQGQLSR
ncbi:MAG: hypothetical protein JW914_01840 [Syntrophaceae bacterium]|nr:hypothetical protein [Syntrophaceae bacterium]